MTRLKKEIRELRRERDFFKLAAAHFAKEQLSLKCINVRLVHRFGATPPGVAEAMDAVMAGDIGLLLSYFRKAQVVVAEVCREMVLVVAEEEWGGSGHIGHPVKPGPHHASFSGIG